MRYITKDDILDIYIKANQRGLDFVLSKLNLKGKARTKSAFDQVQIQNANWWIVPEVQKRWFAKVSNNPEINFIQYIMKVLGKEKQLKLISLGSGNCTKELELAEYPNFQSITCMDLAQNRLNEARKKAEQSRLTNIEFVCTDITQFKFPKNHYDVFFFNSALHHFDQIDNFFKNTIIPSLKPDGKLVIIEFVGSTRLQFPQHQIKAINEAIKIIPKPLRKRFKTNSYKSSFSGSGIWRMKLADPSECIDSASIIPTIHKYFNIVEERPYGGNILANVLKDISHQFIELNNEKKEVLHQLFQFEDDYLQKYDSDYILGVYQLKKII